MSVEATPERNLIMEARENASVTYDAWQTYNVAPPTHVLATNHKSWVMPIACDAPEVLLN